MSTTTTQAALEVGLRRLPIGSIRKSPTNSKIYAPRTKEDIRKLALSIRQHGLLEPIGVSRDGFIFSGHSRHRACRALGMTEVDCRVADVWAKDPAFVQLIVECNRQREKSLDELVRECLATVVDREDAYAELKLQRKEKAVEATVKAQAMTIRGRQSRKQISKAKQPMLQAVLEIIKANEPYWPMSDRSIHYELLNDPPLRNAGKPESYFNRKGELCWNRYINDVKSYKDLTDLLTRARVFGLIEIEAIADPTRTSEAWNLDRSVRPFIDRELKWFLANYERDLQQSQPNHIEIVGEKNTVAGSIKPIAEEYGIPYTIARGYSSYEPRHKIRERFWESGKERLVVLVMSDFDPEGEDIPNSFGKSLRDDLGMDDMDVVKVCLTQQQAVERGLISNTLPKKKSSRYKAFVAKYGVDCPVFELEALPSAERSNMLREAILSVLDVDAYNREIERHKDELARLATLREGVKPNTR